MEVLYLRIIEYKIPTQIFVKAEITKLSPLPIVNNSNNYNIVIPSVVTNLPDNIMFIQETLIVNPNSTENYIPKLIKLGVTLSQSMATSLPKGIELKLLIIDNISAQFNIDDITTIKSNDSKKNNQSPIMQVDSNSIKKNIDNNVIISDGDKIKVDNERKFLLDTVDKMLDKQEEKLRTISTNTIGNNSAVPIVNELPIQEQQQDQIIINEGDKTLPQKRGRGRPRKYPIAELTNHEKEARNEFKTLMLNDDEIH